MDKGAIKITGYISPTSESDTYATHVDDYGQGGYRSVADILERDNISEDRRNVGMLVYVRDTKKIFQLIGGIANENWENLSINYDNLPFLGRFNILEKSFPKIYIGTDSGIPETSESYGYTLLDIIAINTRFATGTFIMASAPLQFTYPKAQFISNLPNGIIAKTGSTLRGAQTGIDYVDVADINSTKENHISTWVRNNNKTLRNTRVKIIDGTIEDGDDLQGIRTFFGNSVICRGGISSDDSVFGLNNIGTRELKIYDRNDVGSGRLSKSVNFISAVKLESSVNFYLPETPSSLGQVLVDVGETIYDNRLFRKLEFVDIASNSAKYILQEPNESLPNAQALDSLGLGILKTTQMGVLALAIKDVDYASKELLEEIKSETETFRNQAQSAAEEATAAAEEATTAATEATTAAAEATGAAATAGAEALAAGLSATSASGAAITAGAEALAAGISAISASSSSSSASSSATNASSSATNAAGSETNAAGSATNASSSATNSAVSATNALNSATNSAVSATNALNSATNAAGSETNAAGSATNAASSETNSAVSATNSASSETNAAVSATNSASSETNAAVSATNSASSETNADVSATSAAGSAISAGNSATSADVSATSAASYATNAGNSATIAGEKAVLADVSATEAIEAKTEAETNATFTEQLKIQVQQLISQYMQGSMSTSIIDISWSSQDDPNEPKVFNNNFKKITTLTEPPLIFIPLAAARYGVIDSSLTPTNPDVKSIFWQHLYNFGNEEIVNANYSVDFYHKILNQVIRPFEIYVTENNTDIYLNGFVYLNSKNLKGLADPVDMQDATTKAWVENYVNENIPVSNITLTGAVIGSGIGTIDTTLNPIQNITNSTNKTVSNYNFQPTGSPLISTDQIIIKDDSFTTARFINRISRKSETNNSFEYVHWIDDSNLGFKTQIFQMNFVTGENSEILTPAQSHTFFTAFKDSSDIVRINLNGKVEIPAGTLPNHAVNKEQLDTKALNDFQVTNDVDLGTYRALSSVSPTQPNHLTNKTYVDSLIGASGGVWELYTPNILAFTTAPNKPSGHILKGAYRITGKSCLVSITYSNNGSTAGVTSGSGYYIITLPPNVTIDTSKIHMLSSSNSTPGYYNAIEASVLGTAILTNGPNQIENNVQVYSAAVSAPVSGLVLFRMSTSRWNLVSSSSFALNASNFITYQINAEFPIL